MQSSDKGLDVCSFNTDNFSLQTIRSLFPVTQTKSAAELLLARHRLTCYENVGKNIIVRQTTKPRGLTIGPEPNTSASILR
jgi:hypothetical protein